ncbi:MAG: FAD-binding oxidoreductase [Candidatus Nezhaarchaeota archaeon]|nr:FAD-binding oxidoreductase [Candidatus Nezhaarchaeota archaeon]
MIEENMSAIVGSKHVLTDPKDLEKYSKDNSFVSPKMPICVVKPGSLEEVQEIMLFANRYLVPLVPYSTGKNNQGAAVPSVPAVVVDVSRLNRLLEVNTRARVALVEPGLTFSVLQKEAKKRGFRALMPVGHPASASALITALEHVPFYAWPRYETELVMTIAAVVPRTCGVLRSGMWGIEGARDPYEPGEGPLLFLSKFWHASQGTLGIVVAGHLKLKDVPEVNRVLFMPFEKLDDALRAMHRIRRLETGEELLILNSFDLALLMSKDPEEFEDVRAQLAPWYVVHVLRGSKDEVDYQEADLKDLALELNMKVEPYVPGLENAPERILQEVEEPGGWEKTSRYKGARNTIPFITIQKRVPIFLAEVLRLAEKHGYSREDVGFTIVPIKAGPLHCEFSFHRDPEDPEDTKRVRELYVEAGNRLVEMNAHFDKPYPLWASAVYQRAERWHRILRKVKKSFDPNNIMNPGKLMLW